MFSFPICLLLLCYPLATIQTNEMELSNYLTGDFIRYARPVLNSSHPVNVMFGFELVQILQVLESEQTIKVKVWMRISWKNEFMTWDPAKYGGVERTQLDYETAWTPDIFLIQDVNEEEIKGPDSFNTPIVAAYDGTHTWMVPVVLQSSCEFSIRDFPYDKQCCHFKFVSWTHDKTELDIKLDPRPVITDDYVISPEWDMIKVDRNLTDKYFACCPNPYVNVLYKVWFDRKPLYYVYNLIVPCIILMLIILVQFFLPPESGERIGVLITVLLVFAVYLEVVSGSLPKTSNSLPAMSNFYILAMAISSFSLLATCLVLIVYFKGEEVDLKPVPKWAYKIFIEGIDNCLGMCTGGRSYDEEREIKERYDRIYNDEIPLMETKDEDGAVNGGIHANSKLLDEVRVITKRFDAMDRDDEIKVQWRTLAKYLDRLFCLVFLVTFVILCLHMVAPFIVAKREHLNVGPNQ